MDTNIAMFPFVLGSVLSINTDFYMNLHLESNKSPIIDVFSIQCMPTIDKLLTLDKLKLLYHVNKPIIIHRLYITLSIAPNILAITHKKDHLGFSYCYKIIAHI